MFIDMINRKHCTSEEGAITPAMLNPFVCYEKQGF